MIHYKRSVFIFRRDLRLQDNSGLSQALAASQQVIPCFIFDPSQVDFHRYRSAPGLQFMLESLLDLEQQLARHNGRLAVFYDDPERVVARLISQHKVQALFVNRDYTPFSRRRDDKLQKVCQQHNVAFTQCHDALLLEPEYALKKDGTPYTVFTPFYRNARQYPVDQVQRFSARSTVFFKPRDGLSLRVMIDRLQSGGYEERGGRQKAQAILKNLQRFGDYEKYRDYPWQQGTTLLSAHNKFGTCSIREVYRSVKNRLGEDHPLLRELYWRDFFTHIAYHFPHVFGHAFRRHYDAVAWSNSRSWFERWCKGNTGFPLVDAGMRQLNRTGYMHNRVRMVVASFLVKDLHIDWRWGERYFARHLVDYDPAVNNGNWQWAASTGCDAQPYFRIFNPWLQQKKFDADCLYIKHWVEELQDYSARQIHGWHQGAKGGDYPAPLVDHQIQSKLSKAMFGVVAQKNNA